ncbi:MAG: serine/threonine-protein kinase, partial [Planctomycetota bacterium]
MTADGKPFGPYHLLRELGRGGMGVVHEALEPKLNRRVALKMLLQKEGVSEDQIDRFLREAKAVARLSHPHIVPVFDFGEIEGVHFFTMEMIQGETLAEKMKGDEPLERALDWMWKIAMALDHAHKQGVVHRDVKPENILIDEAGEPRLMDFGLAKDFSQPSLTRSSSFMGTAHYVSPEQAKAKTKKIGPRSDLFSLGAILYEIVTGKKAFPGSSLINVLNRVVNEDVKFPKPFGSPLARGLRSIITRCLEKDPEDRFGSASEFAEALDQLLRETGKPRRSGLYARVQKKSPVPWIVGGGILLGLLLAAFALLSPGDSTPGSLRLRGVPKGARILIDEKTSPPGTRTFPLDPGKHTLRIEKKGFENHTLSFSLKPGEEKTLSVDMQPHEGQLSLTSVPPGAEVVMDGQPTEVRTPTGPFTLPVGNHTLVWTLKGFETHRETVEILKDDEKRIEHRFRPLPVLITVDVSPPGAAVTVDGEKKIAGKPMPLLPGTHRLRIACKGYEPIEKEIVVEPLKEKSFTFQLAKSGTPPVSPFPKIVTLRIAPANPKIEPGGTLRFQAIGKTGSGREVILSRAHWACESGQIDESGLFTAPQTPSRIKVTAVDPETRIAGNTLVEVEAKRPAIVALEGEPAERTI